ncbi:hypothetical protein BV22DRAFT_998558 [Leucogyrophana mollusca]|uniref:Uncharacterized protein n=1 Tax=Leucogyrophana mollusca TaxID=85980 RepID=A0ACB8BZ20_9AGAM|nr:hypothetical protein BV22DRAFT_998558 [Leucogyrophana mollusca]
MFSLPDIGGRFAVGATTFRVPVTQSRSFGNAQVRSYDTDSETKPALSLEEVAFTAYYPAQVDCGKTKKGLLWLIRPVQDSLRGYAHFSGISPWLVWPILYLYGALLKIPVYPNAPLLDPQSVTPASKTESAPWPLVIFSHGLGGSRTAYSQLCTRLASSGRVVLAMEHRDGSGHACIPSNSQTKLYIKERDVIWAPGTKETERDISIFRGDQLAFRRHEIYIAYDAFRSIVQKGYQGSGRGLQAIDGKEIDWSSWLHKNGRMSVECDKDVTLVGHSFGGATTLSILCTDPPVTESPPIPITKALILDPWLEPLPSPGPSPPPHSLGSPLPSILVINSEPFTLWKDHFERLVGIVEEWEPEGRRLLTLVRSQHTSFSDFPLLPLVARRPARITMDKILQLSLAFFDNSLDETLDINSTRKMETQVIGQKADGKPKRKIIGDVADIIVH